ncbi:MAG: hypothetical protein Q7K26_00670 [bacterium]|nr:hypothetical protein [bacterium]
MREEVLLKEVHGFKLFRLKSGPERVIRITNGMFSVRIGQLITASGRYHVPIGTVGIVTSIAIPFEDGYSSDVIVVWFEGCDSTSFMKFADLQLEPL